MTKQRFWWIVALLTLLLSGVFLVSSYHHFSRQPVENPLFPLPPDTLSSVDYGKINETPSSSNSSLTTTPHFIHFIDVGQGNSVLLQLEETNILIDAGTYEYGNTVVNYLKSLGIDSLDMVVATHPHADHVGGLAAVYRAFPVEQTVLPRVTSEHQPELAQYQQFLEAVNQEKTPVLYPKANDLLLKTSKSTLRVLNDPQLGELDGNLNNYSLCLRLDTLGVSALFTGDAEEAVEKQLLASQPERLLKADLYLAGHHGSTTSNTQAFLNKVRPEVVIIQSATDNDYGLPHDAVVRRFEQLGSTIRYSKLEKTIVYQIRNGSYRDY